MKKFNHFITEQELMQNTAEDLMEKLITFGGKAYPKFGPMALGWAGGCPLAAILPIHYRASE